MVVAPPVELKAGAVGATGYAGCTDNKPGTRLFRQLSGIAVVPEYAMWRGRFVRGIPRRDRGLNGSMTFGPVCGARRSIYLRHDTRPQRVDRRFYGVCGSACRRVYD